MAWPVLITHQTQTRKKMLRFARNQLFWRLELPYLALCGGPAVKPYLAASFSDAIDPAAPSLSASFTLAHSTRAMSCLPSAA